MPLIVLEGIDGCGKSTQADRLCVRLADCGQPPLRLREPGGTALGEAMRNLLLDPATQACPVAELFGYLQARAQLVQEVLRPALAAGRLVLLDRFWHSTLAYQAYGLGLDPGRVRAAINLSIDGLHTDLAVLLRLDPAQAASRRQRRQADRIEARGLDYQRRVAAGYEHLVASGDLVAIDATADPTTIAESLWRLVEPLLQRPG